MHVLQTSTRFIPSVDRAIQSVMDALVQQIYIVIDVQTGDLQLESASQNAILIQPTLMLITSSVSCVIPSVTLSVLSEGVPLVGKLKIVYNVVV